MSLLVETTRDLPGIFVEVSPDLGGPSFDNPIELSIYGNTEQSVNDAVEIVERLI